MRYLYPHGKKYFLTIILIVGCVLVGICQDTHLSQFWLSPTSINPATAGFFDGNVRLGAYYRTQWRAISEPYQTAGLEVDLPLKKRVRQQDIFSMGINVDYDIAGDSKYSTIQGMMSLAYAHALNHLNNHFLMGGISAGCVQRSWSYSLLKFDEQYQNGTYDPHILITEQFPSNGLLFFDCGAGLAWFYQPSLSARYQAGFSMYHFNRAKISLYKDDDVRLPIKYISYFWCALGVRDNMELQPSIFFARQAKYQEIQLGMAYAYFFHFDSKWYINQLNIGLYYRWGDAIYLAIGGEWRRLTLGISYDFNVSKLMKASEARGSVEVNLSYIFKTYKVPRAKSIPCYLF